MTYANADPKPKRYTNEKYLNTQIRGHLCGVHGCHKACEPHHMRKLFWGAGTSQTSHDYVALRRCRDHHHPHYDDMDEIIQNLKEYSEIVRPEFFAKRFIIDSLIEQIEKWRSDKKC